MMSAMRPFTRRSLLASALAPVALSAAGRALGVKQSTVSRRLKLLADHGWVQRRAAGTATLYRCVSDDLPPELRGVWNQVREAAGRGDEFDADMRRLRAVIADRRPGSAAFFGRVGAQWDDVSRELFGERYAGEAVASLLPGGMVVADVGCGTGVFASMFAPMASRVIGIDREPTMLDAARSRLGEPGNIELKLGEAESLPLEDESVDLVVLGLVLHHLESPQAALKEAARVLKPDGRVLVVDMQPHGREEFRLEMGHRWLGIAESQLREWCEAVGLKVVGHRPLPSSPEARGPEVFAATAVRST